MCNTVRLKGVFNKGDLMMFSNELRNSLGVISFVSLLVGAWFLFWGNEMLDINGAYDTGIIYTTMGIGFIFAIVGKGIFRILTLSILAIFVLIVVLFGISHA